MIGSCKVGRTAGILEYSRGYRHSTSRHCYSADKNIGTLQSMVEIYDEETGVALTDNEILEVPQLTEIEDGLSLKIWKSVS